MVTQCSPSDDRGSRSRANGSRGRLTALPDRRSRRASPSNCVTPASWKKRCRRLGDGFSAQAPSYRNKEGGRSVRRHEFMSARTGSPRRGSRQNRPTAREESIPRSHPSSGSPYLSTICCWLWLRPSHGHVRGSPQLDRKPIPRSLDINRRCTSHAKRSSAGPRDRA